ncbi:hypothetical protein GH714_023016 [Hevea brasiliensis]|uniref:Uncharacterized protein n=1 Tax=Hevea brasiliensis TaxID=3981 RepID=A0A6A6MQE5_HEVBR|nr:hypothetical protein GH714_023016 [Hevea brasiliensis]
MGKEVNLQVEQTLISRVFRSGARVSSVDRGRGYAAPASGWWRCVGTHGGGGVSGGGSVSGGGGVSGAGCVSGRGGGGLGGVAIMAKKWKSVIMEVEDLEVVGGISGGGIGKGGGGGVGGGAGGENIGIGAGDGGGGGGGGVGGGAGGENIGIGAGVGGGGGAGGALGMYWERS